MESVFDLKTSTSEIVSSNRGTSQVSYRQHAPTRASVGDVFPNGSMSFRWENDGTRRWVPSRSYMRIRVKLTDAAGAQLKANAGIGPNMGLAANLFQNGEFRINDKTVSRISDSMAQIDALYTRTTKTSSWLDGVGSSTNWWQTKLSDRIAAVSSDGKDVPSTYLNSNKTALGFAGGVTIEYTSASRTFEFKNGQPDITTIFQAGDGFYFNAAFGALPAGTLLTISSVESAATFIVDANAIGGNVQATADAVWNRRRIQPQADRNISSFELIWQPPLSIFRCDKALPSGRYELMLTPATSTTYQALAVESLTPKVAGTDFKFSITDIYFYTQEIEAPRVSNLTYYLDLAEIRIQLQNIESSTGLQQKSFDVSPSTYALAVVLQDSAAGSVTTLSASKFKVTNNQDLNLNRLYVSYAGINKPSPDADPTFSTADATDSTAQRYAEALLQTGLYFNVGGSERIQDYHDRGSYYFFVWPKDGSDRSTRASVNVAFSQNPTNMKVGLFDLYRQMAKITIVDGAVQNVEVLEV